MLQHYLNFICLSTKSFQQRLMLWRSSISLRVFQSYPAPDLEQITLAPTTLASFLEPCEPQAALVTSRHMENHKIVKRSSGESWCRCTTSYHKSPGSMYFSFHNHKRGVSPQQAGQGVPCQLGNSSQALTCPAFSLLVSVIKHDKRKSPEIMMSVCLQKIPNNAVAPQKFHCAQSSTHHCKNTFLDALAFLFTCSTVHNL